jgi:hypothetical protein
MVTGNVEGGKADGDHAEEWASRRLANSTVVEYGTSTMKARKLFCAVALFSLTLPDGAVGAETSSPRLAPDSRLTPVHHRAPQVSGCEVVGKAFGTIAAGGAIIFKGERFDVTDSQGRPDRIDYSGPRVRAVFTPKRGHKVTEGDNGSPERSGPDVPGTIRIEIAGSVITTSAREHCIVFE